MEVTVYNHGGVVVTSEEQRLIERVRKAVADIHLTIDEIAAYGGVYRLVVVAWIWFNPLRLDFACEQAGADPPAHAHIGPQINLTDELFGADRLTDAVLKNLREGFDDFCAHTTEEGSEVRVHIIGMTPPT